MRSTNGSSTPGDNGPSPTPRTVGPLLSRRGMLGALLSGMPLIAGCGYMVGAPFPQDVRTVSVPIFTSNSFRREFEFMLTEAVQKEIEKQSHIKVVDEGYADARLTGTIIDIRKDKLGETAFDDPRELALTYIINVTWEDLRTGEILRQQQIDLPPEVIPLVAQSSFAPEVGQSLATATDRNIQRLARDIVSRMEIPW